MGDILSRSNGPTSLISTVCLVEAPFIRVQLGGFTMGVYEGKTSVENTANGVVTTVTNKYPNYVQELSIKKINGSVNQYSLTIKYPITENNDPNFFEKLLSSVSTTRKISITYGDFMLPDYIYRDEEAIITKVTNRFNIATSVIDYTIEAVSAAKLTLSGTYNFPSVYAKPSDIIIQKLYESSYHLTDVFVGMRDRSLVEQLGLIATDDQPTQIPTCTNVSILEYISTLVDYMAPEGSGNSAIKSNIYSLATFEDTTGTIGGAYFKVQKIQKSSNSLNQLCTYNIDIGYPSSNVITDFSVNNDENWSMYYNYNRDLGNSDYIKRIDSKGEVEYIFSPQLMGTNFSFKESDSTWWTRVTEYPITATIKLKGLLKPAVLMSYVKLNVWFYGHKHILSGFYLIKNQVDRVGYSGYSTTLTLLRVAPDEDMQ